MEKLDIRLIFAILNGEVTKVINRLLQKCLTEAGFNITPEQWIVLTELSEKTAASSRSFVMLRFVTNLPCRV